MGADWERGKKSGLQETEHGMVSAKWLQNHMCRRGSGGMFDDKGNRQFRKGFRSKWLVHPERMKELFVGAVPIGSNNGKRQVALAGKHSP